MDLPKDEKHDVGHVETTTELASTAPPLKIKQLNGEMYEEALAKYGQDGDIDPEAEKRLKRKLDRRIIPLLGICYFFYYVDKTTLSYAAIFGIKDDLKLKGTDYSLLSSIFYVGWAVAAIPLNLLLQRSPPAYFLSAAIMGWAIFLMAQAGAHSFGALAALRTISGAAESVADPCFMLITSMFYTREEQPSRISAWYLFNGIGVAGGGLIGYGIGQIHGHLASWRYEFLIVGAFCGAWAIVLLLFLPNSPTNFRGFTHDERLMMIARLRKNQTGIEQRHFKADQAMEWLTDYKTLVANIPNGGLSNFSTLVIKGMGFSQIQTSLLGIPQGALVVIWIALGALVNSRLKPNEGRCITCGIFMLPTIAGALGFLLAPTKAYVGRLICFYMTGSYQASFVIALSILTSNTGGQTKKMLTTATIWFGACIGNIVSPYFYLTSQQPKYQLGIGSLLVANIIELCIFVVLRFALKWENRKKDRILAALTPEERVQENATSFSDLTDKQNKNFRYVF